MQVLNAPRGVEFSPERHRIRWSGGTSASTPGMEVSAKIAKTSLIDTQLAFFMVYGKVLWP